MPIEELNLSYLGVSEIVEGDAQAKSLPSPVVSHAALAASKPVVWPILPDVGVPRIDNITKAQ